ncbi:MAG: LuxR C-terminal-related transcriptional regulator, partial [Anaerolineae bacterium]
MADSTDKPALSKRELEVLKSLAKGHSNQEIARELVISVNTVRVHLRNIFAKLEVQSRTEATMRAVQEGWVTPVTPNGDVEPAAGAKATPALAAWQKVYFGVAVIVAALVFFTPLIKPAINRPARDPFVDSNPKAVIPVPPVPNEEWAYQAQMPTARSRFALVAYNGLLYLMGGDRTSGTTGLVEVFDPATKTWQELASKPTLTANIQGAAIGGEIYVAGGCANTTQVTDRLEIFDPAGNSWRTGAPLPQPLCAYAAAVSNG